MRRHSRKILIIDWPATKKVNTVLIRACLLHWCSPSDNTFCTCCATNAYAVVDIGEDAIFRSWKRRLSRHVLALFWSIVNYGLWMKLKTPNTTVCIPKWSSSHPNKPWSFSVQAQQMSLAHFFKGTWHALTISSTVGQVHWRSNQTFSTMTHANNELSSQMASVVRHELPHDVKILVALSLEVLCKAAMQALN